MTRSHRHLCIHCGVNETVHARLFLHSTPPRAAIRRLFERYPIAVMRHLRHKKLETTMHYIKGITINGEEEFTCKTAQNIKEATDLIEHGFQYVNHIGDIALYRKRK